MIFKALGIVQSNGVNTNESNKYSFDDKLLNSNELNNNNYYRLKIIEVNGVFHYSNIIRFYSDIKNNNSSKFYPIPADNNGLSLDLNSKNSTIVNFKIYTLNGKLNQNKTELLKMDFNKISLNASLLFPEIYLIDY